MDASKQPLRVPRSVWAVFLTGLLFVVYAGTFSGLSDGRILGNDAIGYASELARGTPHLNPHHLAFHPLAAAIQGLLAPFENDAFRLRTALGLAMTAQVLLSALGGALAALFFYRAARMALGEARGANAAALALTAALAFSAGHWLYASVGETYLPAIAAETLLIGLALRERLGSPAPLLGLVAALVAAVLLRQDSVLVALPVALLLTPRRGALVLASAGALALSLYVVAWLGADTGVGFTTWLRGLANSGLWGAPVSLKSLGVGGTLALTSLSYPLWFASQGFLHGHTDRATASLLMGLAPWVLLVLGPRLGRLRGGGSTTESLSAERRRALLALLAFALLRFSFFAWWQPGNMEYHTGTLAPLFLALGVWLGGRPASVMHAAGAWAFAAVLVVAGNVSALIGPNQGKQLDERALEALETAGPGGLVLSLDGLGFLALERARGTSVHSDPPLLLDASLVASGTDLTQLPELRATIAKTLAAGGKVIAARDMVLPERFKHAPWPLDWTDARHEGGMDKLVEGLTPTPLSPGAGLDSPLWRLE